ncbi:MAG: PepSY domain-containing protein [Lewinellaceae bacterium]|nr:PepSY domain-containing protein [Lewinellaceae bacterium]
MKQLIFLALWLPQLVQAQMEVRINPTGPGERMEVIAVPREMTADSLVQYIYNFNPNEYGIEYKQKFGWLKLSDKFDTDEFYQWTKQYCIDRVGEAYFYDNFRLDWHSFKDEAATEIYEIRYYFFPPGFAFAHQRITFKKYAFLGMEEIETPANLPDCRKNPGDCVFPVTREKAEKIAEEKVIKGRDVQLYIEGLTDSYEWKCVTATPKGWAGENFTIDARTGEVSEQKKWHRID